MMPCIAEVNFTRTCPHGYLRSRSQRRRDRREENISTEETDLKKMEFLLNWILWVSSLRMTDAVVNLVGATSKERRTSARGKMPDGDQEL